MTTPEIQAAAERQMVKFETAKKIRELLDAAAEQMGDDYDEDEILELVTG